MAILLAIPIGLIFGLGIVVSGMVNPAKVLNFFDAFGTFDPSLGFVMAGALAVAVPGYALILRARRPVFAPAFDLPKAQRIDRALVLGSATFGIGWGIAGFCPGAALPALGTGKLDVALFVAALVAGLLFARLVRRIRPPKPFDVFKNETQTREKNRELPSAP